MDEEDAEEARHAGICKPQAKQSETSMRVPCVIGYLLINPERSERRFASHLHATASASTARWIAAAE
jgi:uncharacterized protein YgiB involved in biofilm formation